MPERMSIWGVGPQVFTPTAAMALVAAVLTSVWPRAFRFPAIPDGVRTTLGLMLLFLAIPVYLVAVRAMLRAHREQRLLTSGIYAVCRHPIYAGWIVLIWPGVALLANSWLLLTLAAWMYVLVRRHVAREEANLEAQFGADYLRYRQRVNAIFPTLRRR